MKDVKILWVDDEIDHLKSHILFLKSKGYDVQTANNAIDALEIIKENLFDMIFLDENMPGMSGIEMLEKLRTQFHEIPVVMITKSEEEKIMDSALGNNIKDYLIKPVNPNQILMAIKKIIDHNKLREEKTTTNYQQSFRTLGFEIYEAKKYSDWFDIYRKLILWELTLQESGSPSDMQNILQMQKDTANTEFAKFIKNNYIKWFNPATKDRPIFSQNVFKHYVFPYLEKERIMILVIDNLRFDQWLAIKPLVTKHYTVEQEIMYYSILPTATQFARNALFAGLMPDAIRQIFPDLWKDEDEDGLKNVYETELFKLYLNRHGYNIPFYFEKATNTKQIRKIIENPQRFIENNLSVLVYNFIDILSHARTDVDIVKELASTEPAYRNLTRSWYEHSPLSKLIEYLSNNKVRLFITTDHGTIKISNPVKIIGERKTTTNLRYKQGKNLSYNNKNVFEISKPEAVSLPRLHASGKYVFACENDFFAYPNNYNYYANYYRDTFQHGGVSLEEMLVPFVSLIAK